MIRKNTTIITGNLTAKPELRFTPKGTPVANARVIHNNTFKDGEGQERTETVAIDIELWGKRAEAFTEHHDKGSHVYLEGNLKMEQWEDKETKKNRSKLSLKVSDWQFNDAPKRTQAPADEPQTEQE